jgi:hypothetical protein
VGRHLGDLGENAETSTGKEQVAVLFDFLDVPGKTLTWYGYWTEATWERTIETLRTCGWTGNEIDDLSELSGETPEVFVVLDHEPDQNGAMRERIKWVNKTNGLAMKKALDPARAKEFAARAKAQILMFDQTHGTKPKAAVPF